MRKWVCSLIKSVCAPGLGTGVQSRSCESGVEDFAQFRIIAIDFVVDDDEEVLAERELVMNEDKRR